MLSRPHGGRLIQRTSQSPERDRLLDEVERLPRLDISSEIASDVWNLGIGAFSPLEGFMGAEDFRATLYEKRLTTGVPWTIPIVLDASAEQANRLGQEVALWYAGQPLALILQAFLEVRDGYSADGWGARTADKMRLLPRFPGRRQGSP